MDFAKAGQAQQAAADAAFKNTILEKLVELLAKVDSLTAQVAELKKPTKSKD